MTSALLEKHPDPSHHTFFRENSNRWFAHHVRTDASNGIVRDSQSSRKPKLTALEFLLVLPEMDEMATKRRLDVCVMPG